MNEAIITLTYQKEMLLRLRSCVGNTAPLNKFYARLCEHAEKKYCADDFVSMLISEIADHTIGMTAIDMDILVAEAPRLIHALVDDQLFVKVAKAQFLERMVTV